MTNKIKKLIALHDQITPFYIKNQPFFRFKNNIMFEEEGRQMEVPDPTQEEIDTIYSEYANYLQANIDLETQEVAKFDQLLESDVLDEEEKQYLREQRKLHHDILMSHKTEKATKPDKPKL